MSKEDVPNGKNRGGPGYAEKWDKECKLQYGTATALL
jgi:hypothetical protein